MVFSDLLFRANEIKPFNQTFPGLNKSHVHIILLFKNSIIAFFQALATSFLSTKWLLNTYACGSKLI